MPTQDAAVVVGVDGSAPSFHALEWALEEADILGSACRVVSVHPAAGVDLDRLVMEARHGTGQTRVHVDVEISDGRPAERLVAASAGAALVVVGTRGRSAPSEALLGSVAESTVSGARCPVVVLPPAARAGRHFGRIVVGVDGSGPAMAALRWAAERATTRDADLVLVYAWHVPAGAAATGAFVAADTFAALGQEVLHAAIVAVAHVTPRVHARLVQGAAAAAILHEATGADLIVVGSRGRGAVAGAAMGSVSQACARHAPCPVAILRGGVS